MSKKDLIKGTWILDIEVYKGLFFVGIKDYKREVVYTFEISPRKDEREKLYKALTKFSGFLVTFNGLHYDEVVLSYFIKNYKKLNTLSVKDFCLEIKDFSDNVIHEDFEKIKYYKWFKRNWTSIDLFCYWSKNLRQSKQISLKGLAIQLNHEEIQELPFDINHEFTTDEEYETLINYNTANDLGVTEKVFNALKGQIELRGYIEKTYGLKCWSLDAPKIASEYLLRDYCEKTFPHDIWKGKEEYEEKKKDYEKMVRSSRYTPPPFVLKDYLPDVKFKTKLFQDLHEKFKECAGKLYENFAVNVNDTSVMLLPSIGGIHSVNNNQYWESDDEWVLLDCDIASLYPTLFRNYSFLRKELQPVLDKYCEIIDDRISAKRAGDKVKDTFLKLILNSFSGLADSNVNWVYSPIQILTLRCFGQLIQLKLIEEATLHKGVKCIFSNTDGSAFLVKRDMLPKMCEILNENSKEFKVTWEMTLNKKMVFSNTNTYISIIDESFMLDDDCNWINHKKDLNKVKTKGSLFRYGSDIPLGDSCNEQVIPKALVNYFAYGIDPEEFIRGGEKSGLSIFDFCVSKKVNRSFYVEWGGEKVQNLNRYYFSKRGRYLIKIRKNNGQQLHMHRDNPVIIYNNHNSDLKLSDYDLDFNYYIGKVKKLINEMETTLRNPSLFEDEHFDY